MKCCLDSAKEHHWSVTSFHTCSSLQAVRTAFALLEPEVAGVAVMCSLLTPVLNQDRLDMRKKRIPLFYCITTSDPFVPVDDCRNDVERLRGDYFEDLTLKEYPGKHAVCTEMLDDVMHWMEQRIPEHFQLSAKSGLKWL